MSSRLSRAVATCMLLLASSVHTGGGQDTGQPPPLLQPGTVVRAALAGGSTARYRIDAPAGIFFRVVASDNVDFLGMRLSGVDGAIVRTIPVSTIGLPRVLSYVTAAEGGYVLEVRREMRTVAPAPFELKLDDYVPANESHRARVSAEISVVEAFSLSTPDEASRDKAPSALLTARQVFREAQDSLGEALALRMLASTYAAIGNLDAAVDGLRQEIALHRAAGDVIGETTALESVAWHARTLGDLQLALDSARAAVVIARGTSRPGLLSSALMTLGNALASANDPEAAAAAFEQAHAVEVRPIEPDDVLGFAAQQRNRANQKQLAAADFEAAAALCRRAGFEAEAVAWEVDAARMFAEAGRPDDARRYLERAEAFWASRPASLNYQTKVKAGEAYAALGDRERALDHLGRALSVPPGQALRPRDLGAFGPAYGRVGEFGLAIAADEETLTFVRAAHDPRREAQVLARLAKNERGAGRLPTARAHIEQALALFESLRSTIASPAARITYAAAVQQHYEFYVDLLMRLHERDPDQALDAAALAATERARARGMLDLLADAGVDIREGVDPALVRRERELRERLNALANRRIALAARPGLTTQLAALVAEFRELDYEHDAAEGRLRAASPSYAALMRPDPLTLAGVQSQVLDGDTVLLEYALGDERSFLWAVSNERHASFTLPPRADIEAQARRVYALLAAPRRPKDGETPAEWKTRLADTRTRYRAESGKLADMLLRPAVEWLGDRRLFVIAQGALQYIPFGALPEPAGAGAPGSGPPLIERHEIVYAPSASVMAALRSETTGRPAPPGTLAVLADPVFERGDPRVRTTPDGRALGAPVTRASSFAQARAALERSAADVGLSSSGRFPRLAFSRREADAVVAALPSEQVLRALDFRASRETAMSPELAGFRIVHVATHGLLDSGSPELSGLVLSLVDERGGARDGFLRLQDVFNLRWPADLVVLSACQTALGKDVKGEGFVGLTRGFMYAGAARVAASLWRVDDAATADLMSLFYRRMLGQGERPSAALRAAANDLRRQAKWNDPHYWAAFALHGEWR